MNAGNGMTPVHPGAVLRDELDELGLLASSLANALGVPVNRVTMILNGQRGVTTDTALQLARYFGTTPQLWLNLQKAWELRRAEIDAGRENAEGVTPCKQQLQGRLQDDNARLTASGSFWITRNSVAAGPLTLRVPCSHFL